MILLANLLSGVAHILGSILTILMIVIIAHAVLSWVSPDPMNPIVRFIRSVSEPLLMPVRRIIPPVGPGIDLSPIIVLFVVILLQSALVQTMHDYSRQMKYQTMMAP